MIQGQCVVCGGVAAPMCLVQMRGVPHGQADHKVVYDYKVLFECGSCHGGTLEVHSHDCWSHEEPWEMYWWYAVSPSGVEGLNHLMRGCPSPLGQSCHCGVHQSMRHELSRIHSGIPHATSVTNAKQYCWLFLNLNKNDSSVSVEIDESRSFGQVGQNSL
jgi:hypothetical protein